MDFGGSDDDTTEERTTAVGDESGSWPAVSIRRPNRLRHWAGLRIRPMAAEEIRKSPRVRRG